MTEAQLTELRRWGTALVEDGRPETSAAGRAILLLVEEVERLRAELGGREAGDVGDGPESDEPLRHRLGRLARPR